MLIPVRREAHVAELQLMDSEPERLAVGTSCYIGGWAPPGARALQSLVRLRDVDALARVTEAPTFEGRLYAHIGLRELGVLDDAQLTEFVERIPTPVWTCEGCIRRSRSAAEAVSIYGL